MSWHYDVAAGQVLGQRSGQEDAFSVQRATASGASSEFLTLVMADGAGGESSGQVASYIATQTASRTLEFGRVMRDPSAALRLSVKRANNAISNAVRRGDGDDGMGCTLIAATIALDRLHWASVGDSHFYLLRDGSLEKVNEDHSYGGLIALMEARGKPIKRNPAWPLNALVSALNGGQIVRVDAPARGRTLVENDRLVIASDGLDTLSRDEVEGIVAEAPSSGECVDRLLKAVRVAEAPTQDNTTVVAASVVVRDPGEPTEVDDAADDSFENRILRDYAAGVGTLVD